MDTTMEQKIQATLQEEEQLQWSGRPQPFALMVKPFITGMVIRWLIILPIFIGIIYLSATRFDGRISSVIFYGVLLLACAMFAVDPMLAKRKLLRSVGYALTEQRLVVLNDVSQDKITAYLPLSAIEQVEVEPTNGGLATIYINRACKVRSGASRSKALSHFADDENKTQGIILYNIDNWQELCHALPCGYRLRPVCGNAAAPAAAKEEATTVVYKSETPSVGCTGETTVG